MALKHAPELSKHIWSLKDQKIAYQIKWWKIKQARSYSNEFTTALISFDPSHIAKVSSGKESIIAQQNLLSCIKQANS